MKYAAGKPDLSYGMPSFTMCHRSKMMPPFFAPRSDDQLARFRE